MDTVLDIVLLMLILVIVIYGFQYALTMRVDDGSTKYYKPPFYEDVIRSNQEAPPPSYQEAMETLNDKDKSKEKEKTEDDEVQEIIVIAEVHVPSFCTQ